MAWLLAGVLGLLCIYLWKAWKCTREICVMLYEYNEWLQKSLSEEWDMAPDLLLKDYLTGIASCGMVPGLHQLEESLRKKPDVVAPRKQEAGQLR